MSVSDWSEIGNALAIILAALLLAFLVGWFFNRIVRRLVSRTETELDDALANAVDFPLKALIVVIGLQLAVAQLSFLSEETRLTLSRVFFATNVILVYLLAIRVTARVIDWYGHTIAHRTATDADDRFVRFLRNFIIVVITIGAVIILLARFDVEVSGLVTTLGITSLAVALAAQATLADIIAGFMIMADQPFEVGDRIHIREINTWGDVQAIGLRSTRILTQDHRMVSIPNSLLGSNPVVNYSTPSTMYRVETQVGVAYGSDIEEVRQIMHDAIRKEAWVMAEEPIDVLFMKFGDSSLDFTIRCWIEHFVEAPQLVNKMNTVLYLALTEASIQIPFPQRDLNWRMPITITPESQSSD